MADVSAGDLAQESGATLRQVQFWTDAGVLQALPESDRQGRGRHRLYAASLPWHGERTTCLIAVELNRLGLPVGHMKRAMDAMRRHMAGDSDKAMLSNPIGRALLGRQSLIVFTTDVRGWLSIKIADDQGKPRILNRWRGKDLGLKDPEVIQYASVPAEIPGNVIAEEASGYLLNLTKVLAPLRSR